MKANEPLIVSTEPKALPPTPKGPCPDCKAAATSRMSSGFGRVIREWCGCCGHVFDEGTTR
jgi:hypothetical protein